MAWRSWILGAWSCALGCGASLAPPRPGAELMDVGWRLRLAQHEEFRAVPPALYTFASGRWECALSPVSATDTLATGRLRMTRSRRLACTHPSGVTVQSTLGCTLSLPRTPIDDDDPTLSRTLPLTLSDGAALELVCLPAPTAHLPLHDAAGQVVGRACLDDQQVQHCPSDARPPNAQTTDPR